jgi:uracil-DNA glycosylase family 4
MRAEYTALARSIHQCATCAFRDPAIEPLAPDLPQLPVPVMFVGENPSWAQDQPAPFAETTVSGRALDRYYLQPLGLSRNHVWITDLFKCRYPKAIYAAKAAHNDAIQAVVNTCANLWLLQEIALARPRVLVTLSDREVYQRLRRAFSLATPATFAAAVGRPHAVALGGFALTLFPMIHPDVSRLWGEGDNRKQLARQKWAEIHRNTHIPALRELLG